MSQSLATWGFVPPWPTPANVKSFVTWRGSTSGTPSRFHNNLATHVGDDLQTVLHNRADLLTALSGLRDLPTPALTFQWLQQVHGNAVVTSAKVDAAPEADACVTKQPGLICAIMTADCVPILLCDKNGTQVAAVHAGWRGLTKHIIAAAVKRFDATPQQLLAYIGPTICARCYEVSADVKDEVVNSLPPGKPSANTFYQPVSSNPGQFWLDLVAVAAAQLRGLGVVQIYGGEICNSCDQRFFSHRRDAQSATSSRPAQETGRFASLIWRT